MVSKLKPTRNASKLKSEDTSLRRSGRFTLHRRYQIIAFISGFTLLGYEIAGSRIISPVIGSSTYVWTSVIGIIIAALSLGYFLGGHRADTHQSNKDILLLCLMSALGIVTTLLLSDIVLLSTDSLSLDIRLKAVIASLILFAPTSVVLGALSPYLARMHTPNLQNTGRSIATLSALNSLGGITGTFLVGFVFFSFIGSRETLIVLAGLMLFCSLLLISKERHKLQTTILVLVVIVGLIGSQLKIGSAVVASIETPTTSYLVRDITYNDQPARVLTMGPGGYQSGIYTNGNPELVFGYTKAMANGVSLHNDPKDILVLGGGTFTMPEYLARIYPESNIDAVEIDPELESIAKQYFNYSSPANVSIHSEDARIFMNNNKKDYDIIITDVFSDTGIPFSIVTEEAANKLTESLKPRGVILSNIIAAHNPACQSLLSSIFATYSQSASGVIHATRDTTLETRQNLIAAFSKDNTKLLEEFSNSRYEPVDAQILSDNFAPIERFHQSCLNSV